MRSFLYTLHIITCVSLIVVVLIQRGKGADMGAMLGSGGSQTVFGARGAGNFLTRLTTGSAILFMITSLTLSYFATQDSRSTIFEGEPVAEQQVAPGELDEATDANAGLLEEIEMPVEDAAEGAPEAETAPSTP